MSEGVPIWAAERAREARMEELRSQVSAVVAKQRVNARRKNAAPTAVMAQPLPPPPVVDRYRASLPPEFLKAATQLVVDFLSAEAGPHMTARYSHSGGGGGRPGRMNELVLEKRETVREIRATWDPAFLEVIDWLLLRSVINPDGSAMTLADAGRKISPWKPGEKDTAIGFGRLYQTLALARRYYERRSLKTSVAPTADEVHELLNEGLRRLTKGPSNVR